MAANWGAGASGAASGAMAGGSVGGPWGAAIGGVIGGVAGLFGSKKKKKRSTFDKQQKRLYDLEHQSLLGQGPLADLYNYNPQMANKVFTENYANPAYQDFQEQVVPTITGQFRKQGLMNSSYAGDALSKLARDVQQGLDAKRTQYLYNQETDARNARRNAINSIQGRSTFAYDKAPSNGFNIADITNSATPDLINQAKGWFK
jgi:hypothetical protein